MRRLLHVLLVCAGLFGAVQLLGEVLLVVAIVRSQSEPQVLVGKLDVASFHLIDNGQTGQVSYIDQVTVRDTCLGSIARGFVRFGNDPRDPNRRLIADQIMTNAEPVLAVTPDLLVSSPTATVMPTSVATIAPKPVTYEHEVDVPLPSGLRRGDGWRYAEETSHESCGWLHGILPVHTTLLIGPPIDWHTLETSSAHP